MMKTVLAVILSLIPELLLADLHMDWRGTVTDVIDGNTLVISNTMQRGSQVGVNRTVTLDGMHAPSTNETAGIEACDRLTELVKEKDVRVRETFDMGRIYGGWVVIAESGQVVNLFMIQVGLASTAPIRGYTPREMEPDPGRRKMAEAENEAKRQGIGIWKKEKAPIRIGPPLANRPHTTDLTDQPPSWLNRVAPNRQQLTASHCSGD